MVRQRPLNICVMPGPCGLAVVPPLPDADVPLVDAQSRTKFAPGEARAQTCAAKLAAGVEV